MNWPLFTNVALLGGLALLAVPILVHLLLRVRRKRVRFSTLQFFRRNDEEATRRRKLRNWLLLAARMLLLLLLVLAFARPYLTDTPSAKTTPQRQVVFVLDRSVSMEAEDSEGRRWDRAKAAIEKLMSELESGDRAALIGCASRPETLVSPSAAQDVLKTLAKLKPAHGTADLGQGLQQAARLLTGAGSAFSNTICVVSDLQRASCPNLGSHPVPFGADVKILSIGDRFAPNVAITRLILDPTDGATPGATVVNFSEDNLSGLKLQLSLDGKEISSTSFSLAAGGSTNVEMVFPAPGEGWHSAQTRLQFADAQPLDNVRYETFYVPPPIRLLVVEPRQVPRVFQEESFFVVSALDPTFGLTNAGRSPFALEKIPPADLAHRLQRRSSPSIYSAVVLPGLKSIDPAIAPALAEFVRAGGGLLLFLGDDVSVNRYNTALADLLPVELDNFETAADLDWRLWEYDQQSPVFAPFSGPNSGNFAIAKFIRRVTFRSTHGAPGNQITNGRMTNNELEASEGFVVNDPARVLARFQDGVPLLVERPVGQGRVLLVNSSADTAWSDWPKHRTFVPWMHGLARFLARNSASALSKTGSSLLAGAEAELELGPEFGKSTFTLRGPDGMETSCSTDDQGWLQNLDLFTTSGLYSLQTPQGQELRRWAVNVPPAESELVGISTADFERQLTRSEPAGNSAALPLFGSRDGRRELWPMLLLAGLLLLLIEPLLANRTLA